MQISDDHEVAVGVLADSGLIPPLRLVTGGKQPDVRYVGLGA